MSNDERRQHKRESTPDSLITITLIPDNALSQTSSETVSVKVQNTSSSGICIVTDQPLELGQIIHFPEETINKKGAVVWTYQFKTEYKSGVKFE